MTSRLILFLFLIGYANADQLDSWHWRRLSPQGNALRGVATDGSQFVAVGHHGTIIRSVDTTNWIVVPYADTTDFFSVEFLNGRWFAVGSSGTIAISTNGTTWTVTPTFGVPTNLLGIAYGNGLFCAVGNSATILTSTNGTNWTIRNSGNNSATFNAVTFANDRFVVAGSKTMVSTNGVAWSEGTTHGFGTVTFHRGQFYASRGSPRAETFSSPDGLTWTLVWDGRTFVKLLSIGELLIGAERVGYAFWSPYGSNWVGRAFDTRVYANVEATGLAGTSNALVGIGWQGLLAVGRKITNWSAIAFPESPVRTLLHDSQRAYAVDEEGRTFSSPNGTQWNQTNLFFPDTRAACWGNGRFVAAASGGPIYVSTNGTDWTTNSAPFYVRDIRFADGQFWSADGATLNTSTDCVTWVQTPLPFASSTIAYGNGRYVLVGSLGTVGTTMNRTDWQVSHLGSDNLLSVAFGNNRFVTANGTSVFVSPNGTSWQFVNSLSGPRFIGGFAGGHFLGFRYDQGWNMNFYRSFTSVDGFTWIPRKTADYEPRAVIDFRGTMLFCGEAGTIMQSDPLVNLELKSANPTVLQLFGNKSETYRLEMTDFATTNTWGMAGIFTLSSNSVTFEDQSSTNTSSRFYRAVQVTP